MDIKFDQNRATTLVDEDNLNEAPESSYNIVVCESDVNVNIEEIDSNSPNLVKMIDVLGRIQIEHREGICCSIFMMMER